MVKKNELPEDVLRVIDQASKMVGKFHDELFNQNTWNECLEYKMESPLEQVLYAAFNAVREMDYQDRDEPIEINGENHIAGLGLIPQYQIGKYRADFLGIFGRVDRDKRVYTNEVVVECDSQQFHERTEKERRYEKARDRFFQVKGYKVFRYTGKEILEDPFKVACEIVGFLTEQSPKNLYKYIVEYK